MRYKVETVAAFRNARSVRLADAERNIFKINGRYYDTDLNEVPMEETFLDVLRDALEKTLLKWI